MVSAALDELLDVVAILREGHGADLVLHRHQDESDEGSAKEDVNELHVVGLCCVGVGEPCCVVVVRRDERRIIERRFL